MIAAQSLSAVNQVLNDQMAEAVEYYRHELASRDEENARLLADNEDLHSEVHRLRTQLEEANLQLATIFASAPSPSTFLFCCV